LESVIVLYRERSNTLNELAAGIEYFYKTPVTDAVAAEKHLTVDVMPLMNVIMAQLQSIEWTVESIHHIIEQTVVNNGLKFPKVAMPLRVMLTGNAQSPSIDAVMHLLGQQETLKRMATFF
jgi:glutamyl-tRNA synthetase